MKPSLVFNLKHSGNFGKCARVPSSVLFCFCRLPNCLATLAIATHILCNLFLPVIFCRKISYDILGERNFPPIRNISAYGINNLDSEIISFILNCPISRWLHIKFDRLFFFLIPQEDELKKAILMVFANKQVPFYFSYSIYCVSRATNACNKSVDCIQ